MKFAFKLVGIFWLMAPCAFLVGRALGIWNFKGDWFVFLGLMVMMTISAYLNYKPENDQAS